LNAYVTGIVAGVAIAEPGVLPGFVTLGGAAGSWELFGQSQTECGVALLERKEDARTSFYRLLTGFFGRALFRRDFVRWRREIHPQ
jgi:hypothetical protein